MNINFEYDGVKSSERLERITRKKLEKLEDKFDFIIRADVFFKREKTSSPNTGRICNIRLSVPGPRLFTEASGPDYRAAIVEAVNELDRMLAKKKDKFKSY